MQIFSTKPGLVVRYNDRLWKYARRMVDNQMLMQDEFGETIKMLENEFYRQYEQRALTVEMEQPFLGTVPLVTNAPRDLTTFPQAHSNEAIRRRQYLDQLLDDHGGLPSVKEIVEKVKLIAVVIDDKKRPPSPATVIRWAGSFRRTRCVVRLVPSHRLKGRHPVIHGEIEALLLDVLNEFYLKKEPESVSKIWFRFRDRLKVINSTLAPSQRLSEPSRMSIYRYVNRLDSYLVDSARYGKRIADQNHRTAATQMQVTQILDRWEIDHTAMDVLIVDVETGEVIGRPYLTIILDRASRMVMAFLIHLSAPNTESVLRVIDRAIRPKSEWLARYPSVTCLWLARGLPLRLMPDNAAEFHAGDVYLAFNELGIELMYPRTRAPEMKGAVERFFRTLNTGLIHCLPGTTFSNTKQRGDYDSAKYACLTLPEIEGHILKWIVDVYHQRPHKSLKNKTPAQVWKEGESARPIHLPADLDELEAILAMREKKNLHHYGVELLGLFYNSPELGRLRQQLDPGEKVEVRYRDELGHVWIFNAKRKVFLKVPCTNKTAIGMSRDLYNLARKTVRAAGGNPENFEASHQAYRRIMNDVEQAKRSNKMRQRREAARTEIDKEGNARPISVFPIHSALATDTAQVSLDFDPTSLTGFATRPIE